MLLLMMMVILFLASRTCYLLDGKKSFRAHKTGPVEKADKIGFDVADEILSQAGENFIVSETKLAHTINKK